MYKMEKTFEKTINSKDEDSVGNEDLASDESKKERERFADRGLLVIEEKQ